MTTTTPPGWYDDGNGSRRWWDGANWTEHVAAPAVAASDVAAPAAVQPVDQPTAPTMPLPSGTQEGLAVAPPYVASYPAAAAIAPPYVPGGYATAYAIPPADATPAATQPPKSRMWIVWVVIAAVVLAIVVALAALTPILWMAVTSSGTSPSAAAAPSSTPTTQESSPAVEVAAPTAADEVVATETVLRHNESWLVGDCDGYMATTTEELRQGLEITNCETFAVESRYFAAGVDDYVTTIDDVEIVGSTISVSTSETYMSRYDAEGNQTDEPQQYVDRYEYFVVRSGEGWVIDDYFIT